MDKLNKTFQHGQLLRTVEVQSMVNKIDEIVDALNAGGTAGEGSSGGEGSSDSGNYLRIVRTGSVEDDLVLIHISDKEEDSSQTISATPKIVSIGDATPTNDGLATANDVKDYIEEVTENALFYDDAEDVISVVEQQGRQQPSKQIDSLNIIQL